jgi:hypothetical protein
MHTSIHYARIVLDPKWKGKRQQKLFKNMMGFLKMTIECQGNACPYVVEFIWIKLTPNL